MSRLHPLVRQVPREPKYGMWVFHHRLPCPMACPHVHDQVEVVVVERGWVLHRQCGYDIRLEPGHLIAFWSAFPHQTVDHAPETDLLLLYLPLDLFRDRPATELLAGHWLARNALHDTDPVANLAWARDCLGRSESPGLIAQHLQRLRIEERLLEIAQGQGLDEGKSGSVPRAGRQAITQVIQTVLVRYGEPLTVPELAATVDLNPDYLMRLFKRTVGIGLWEFVLQVRVAQAQHLLSDPDRTVLDAGLAAGFASASRFHAVFRRIAGTTPDRYRTRAVTAARAPVATGVSAPVRRR